MRPGLHGRAHTFLVTSDIDPQLSAVLVAVPIPAVMMVVPVSMVLAALVAKAVAIPVMIVGRRLQGSSQEEDGEEKRGGGR